MPKGGLGEREVAAGVVEPETTSGLGGRGVSVLAEQRSRLLAGCDQGVDIGKSETSALVVDGRRYVVDAW